MADDAGVGLGGDGSVAWKIWVSNARKGSVVSRTRGEYGYLQEGVDEAEYGQNFTIGIKIPREDGEKFAQALAEAAKDAEAHCKEPGYRVTFPLIIEPKNHDQIVITWTSAPTPPKGLPPKTKKKPGKAAAAKPKAGKRKKSSGKPTGKKKKAGKKR